MTQEVSAGFRIFFSFPLRLDLPLIFVFLLQPLAAPHFPLSMFAYLCMFRLYAFFHVGISLARSHSLLIPGHRSAIYDDRYVLK